MRRFHSYGPVDCRYHFCVPRTELVQQCMRQLVDIPHEGGAYFTIWAARQTGKTWLMREMERLIPEHYGEQFARFTFSLGSLRGLTFEATELKHTLPAPLQGVLKEHFPTNPHVENWTQFRALFRRENGLWDRPLILLIDEVDTIPPALLDMMVGQFRELYINRQANWLHGLALTGVRAVVGIESEQGSPFNVQRALHVPNLSFDEVVDLYQQYQRESGQPISAEVIEQVYVVTRGQPGLVSWLGELLTETYNPAKTRPFQTVSLADLQEHPITKQTWDWVWHRARTREPNNTVMNLIAKARDSAYQPFLVRLFSQTDIPFEFHSPLHNYLYMHGIIEPETVPQGDGEFQEVCRFSSPFIQTCLYSALGRELVNHNPAVLPLHPLDELTDLFEPAPDETSDAENQVNYFNLPALLERYKDYLSRLKAKGLNPWQAQPRRKTDLQLTEAVGHFHLYAWLVVALGRQCVVSPEFPTGNGKVDLHIRCAEKQGIIEVKSFVDMRQFKADRERASLYAKQLGLSRLTMAVFVPIDDETILAKLSQETVINGVTVTTVAVGWT